ncbi:hypothetical protein GIB67_001088 [Kingdonia uniflora]|uniref:Uncharacterized protein n=1 Tax=Kingdonia uniflora TaxID=39325 RepID=A0A7J7MG18_9MAGN|nr:hypothetical protein GIB67_001088 [Kingdonia uniflora]
MGGKGKIEIKMIENPTNRQVTYSKRKAGIMKKANELSVLCDAQVSLIMFSGTGKFTEFISPSVTTKEVYDKYQKETGIDLWSSHYEILEENLRMQQEINSKLKREIKQRIGHDDLSDMNINELRGLEQNLERSLTIVRERKYERIINQTETFRRKVRHLEETQYIQEIQLQEEEHHYALTSHDGAFHSVLNDSTGVGSHIFAFRQPPSQPGFQDGTSAYGLHDLRLA